MYNIENLSELTGISRRTIRYYIEQGLLQCPLGCSKGSYYTEEHLNRLKDIQKYSKQGIPLRQIKESFETKKNMDVIDLNEELISIKWERIEIINGIEIHFKSNCISTCKLKKINSFIRNLLESENDF